MRLLCFQAAKPKEEEALVALVEEVVRDRQVVILDLRHHTQGLHLHHIQLLHTNLLLLHHLLMVGIHPVSFYLNIKIGEKLNDYFRDTSN